VSGSFSAWSYAGPRAAAVRQDASSPLVVVDGQSVRDGYNPNTWFKDVRFIAPVAAQWTDEHGHKAGGYQIIPPSCQARRCPAIVITHGYDAAANRFMWDGCGGWWGDRIGVIAPHLWCVGWRFGVLIGLG
jgi:dipeptidyl aminopeptidase/acylaminoacyl peptidase